jgi:uncharacterized protein YbcI
MERPTQPERGDEPFDPIQENEERAGTPTAEEVAAGIANELLRIHRESYGRTAERAISHVIDDTLIVLLDDLELLPNEEFLVGEGRADAVAELRTKFQKAIEPTFRAAVERATGRRVIAFSSHVSLEEPRFAVEIFRLEPR